MKNKEEARKLGIELKIDTFKESNYVYRLRAWFLKPKSLSSNPSFTTYSNY